MRLGTPNYETARTSSIIELRLVIQVNFGDDTTPDYVYFTTHTDVVIPGAISVLGGVLQDVASLSQKLNPIDARSEIGSIDFSLVDRNATVSAVFTQKLLNLQGLRHKFVRLYSGVYGLAWADYRLEQTQIVSDQVSYDAGAYKVKCEDVQRTLRKDVFVLATTTLSQSLGAPDPAHPTATFTVNVLDTSKFQPCVHGTSFTDAPGATVYYFKIKLQDSFEILRATGKTATTFTGVTRAVLGSVGGSYDVTSSDNAPAVEEYVYLEMPAPELAYVLLTGQRPTQPGLIIPDAWHLGIPTAYVDAAQFMAVGTDLYDSTDETKGFITRFEGLSKTDGKAFIEKEILLLCGAFMPVGADGKLGLKRMVGVLTDSAYVAHLDETSITKASALTQDNKVICNDITINWDYLERGAFKQFFHHDRLIDAVSQQVYGIADPMNLSFRGLHAARHTFGTIKGRFDLLRDRYAGPPLRLTISALPSQNRLEVGDVIRVTLPSVRDFAGKTISLDRSFEIQSVKIDQSSQVPSYELFGSSAKAAPANDGMSYALPDAAYITGTALTTKVGIDGNGFSTGNGSIPAGVYYYLGDLTLNTNHIWTINGTVTLWVRGRLTLNGKVDGKGRSNAPYQSASYFGTTIATGRVYWHKSYGDVDVYSYPGTVNKGVVDALPVYDLVNNNGVLSGQPTSLSGSNGATGGNGDWNLAGNSGGIWGGAGGSGGAGLAVICRGLLFGAAGFIDLSGTDGSPGNYSQSVVISGGGSGGAPGAFWLALDGGAASVPILDGYIGAWYGNCPLDGNRPSSPHCDDDREPYHSYYEGRPRENVWQSATRVQYLPIYRAPTSVPYLSASGGMLTFVQAVKPTYYDAFAKAQRGLQQGDLWFKSDAGNQPFSYDVQVADFVSIQDGSIATAQALAAAASGYATAAQNSANAALSQLTDIASDSKLTANEKSSLISDYTALTNEQAGITAQATAFAITTELTAYTGALTSLSAYLGSLNPAWNDIAQTTAIVAATFATKWQGAYSARQTLLNKISDEAAKRAIWAQIPDRPQSLYALDARSAALIETRSTTALFSETFSDPNTVSQWQAGGAVAAELVVTTDSEVTIGGAVLAVGNNNGNDMAWCIHNRLLPFDPNKLYRVRCRAKRLFGTGTFYAGLAGVAADGITWVNTTGVNTISSQHYVAAAGAGPASTFFEYIGYVKGTAASSSGGANPIWSSPLKMQSNVRYVRPMFICNYSNATGQMVLDYFIVEEVALDTQGRPSELYSGDQNATYGADMASNVLNRYAAYLLRTVSDPTALEQIIANLNAAGQPANQRFYRANFLAQNATMRSVGTITATASGSTATITVNAWSIQTDTGVISYNSGTITPLSASTLYYIYCIDATLSGGALTYYATTDIAVVSQNANYIYVGKLTTPASGGNSSGGGRLDWCVAVDSYMPHGLRAADIEPGSPLRVLDYVTFDGVLDAPAEDAVFAHEECVRIVCENGASVICSISTPLVTRDRDVVDVWSCEGVELPTEVDGVFAWSRVTTVDCVGMKAVARISCGGQTFAAGERAGAYILTHNVCKP